MHDTINLNMFLYFMCYLICLIMSRIVFHHKDSIDNCIHIYMIMMHGKKISEEEEVTEVVEVSSRKVSSQLEYSSGKPGGTNMSRG